MNTLGGLSGEARILACAKCVKALSQDNSANAPPGYLGDSMTGPNFLAV